MKEILKVSEFFKEDNQISPFLLGAFFSRYIFINDNKYIVTMTNYKKSQKIEVPNLDFDKYIDEYKHELNNESLPYSYWYKNNEISKEIKLPQGQIFYILENDLNINEHSFYNKIYAKIVSNCSWVYKEELCEEKKSFIRGYMELRGSIDTSANYIAQDYFYNSNFEIKKARLLVDYMNVPYNIVNINFRQLQEQYYTNINQRNTQLRLNIFWYMANIGMINKYKALIFFISRNIDKYKKINNVYYLDDYNITHQVNNILDERLNYYSANVFGKEINNDDIKKMRETLGFDEKSKLIRNKDLVDAVRLFTPDECMGCKNKYKIEDRTFTNKKTGRLYFEIHHVISIGDNHELDDENNLVKLCPACHDTLKRGRATKETQKEIIIEIYNNAPYTLEFAEHFFDTTNFDEIVELTYINLK